MFLKDFRYIPSMGMFGSQAGNISFPTWELVLPVMGMIFVVEEAAANT